jgi:squalene-hopene/tetraprenyl-beta-curcumene cyclase
VWSLPVVLFWLVRPLLPRPIRRRLIDHALLYLKDHQQPDASWQQPDEPPAITAITLKAFVLDKKFGADQPFIQNGFKKLLTYQKDDGSISDDNLATYNTAIAISALADSHRQDYQPALDKAVQYLRELQWTDKIQGLPKEVGKIDANNPNYGGWGYGKKGKAADLSNVQTAIDALHDAGLKPGDPAYQAALKFITRTQNNSETNDQKWAADDGGFIYSPNNGGNSKAGEYVAPDGRKMFRSYGSMTYAGLKSMIYAGLSHDDPRVKAAWDWIRHNWTLDENPGIKYGDPNNPKGADAGLFYYYHTVARALRAYGEPVVTDAKGNKHDWRIELIEHIAAQQRQDGSWAGTQKWMENKPTLSTAYAVLSLEETLQDLKEHPAR